MTRLIASRTNKNGKRDVKKQMPLQMSVRVPDPEAPPSDEEEESVYETEEDEEEDEWIDETEEDEEDEEESEYTTDDGFVVKDVEDEVMDRKEYAKFLQSLFPSKYSKSKADNAAGASTVQHRNATTVGSTSLAQKTKTKTKTKTNTTTTKKEMEMETEKEMEKEEPTQYSMKLRKKIIPTKIDNAVVTTTKHDKKKTVQQQKADAEAEEVEDESDEQEKESEEEEENASESESEEQEKMAGKRMKGNKGKLANLSIIVVEGGARKSGQSQSRSRASLGMEYDDEEDMEEEEEEESETEDEDAPIEDSEVESDAENTKKRSNKNAKATAKADVEEDGAEEDEDEAEEEEEDEEGEQRSAGEGSEGSVDATKEGKQKKGEKGEKREKGKEKPKMRQLVRADLVKERDYIKEQIVHITAQMKSNGIRKSVGKEYIAMNEKMLKQTEDKIAKYDRKEKRRNERIFQRITVDRSAMDDFGFYRKMDANEQKRVIKQIRDINSHMRVEKPYRMAILDLEIPSIYKAVAMKKVDMLTEMMEETGAGASEYFKVKQWLDRFMQIPFGKYMSLPVTYQMPPTPENELACREFICNASKTLDEVTYGMEEAKVQIMQMLSLLITNPNAIGNAIAIHGPMGCGKTTLIREGVSKILNRPFELIALGGATDSNFLEGNGYVYEGSVHGKIVQILMHSKCMNPVIYFDELDKISDTPEGDEITNILTHLTDTSQNNAFHDKYFSEFEFDLSKCLFFFSYNDGNKVNSILKDRMYHIHTKGYGVKEKTIIAEKYLMPKMYTQVNMSPNMVTITQNALVFLINNRCNDEQGVRNLKRCLETIYYKVNMCRFLNPASEIYKRIMESNVPITFPLEVDEKLAGVLVADKGEGNMKWKDMFM